jgi:hypothetical protein
MRRTLRSTLRNPFTATVCASLGLLSLSGCANPFVASDGGTPPSGDAASCTKEGEAQCYGRWYQVCTNGVFVTKATCEQGKVCSVSLAGCAQCQPGNPVCVGDEMHNCDATGKITDLVKTCPVGQCQSGTCTDPCSQSEAKRSYVGCSYWPTVTANSQLDEEFSFAVVVANTFETPATVTVTRGSSTISTTTVQGASLATIKLPWVKDLKQQIPERSTLVADGAYHLISSLPVTVYQFNALEYVVNRECKGEPPPGTPAGKCYSYTNDASLLLPEHALANEYIVVSRPTRGNNALDLFGFPGPFSFSPGFFAVTAPKDGTTKVTVTFSANTQAGATGALKAYSKGQTADFTLSKGSVLQILSQMPASCTPTKTDSLGQQYCDLSATGDLTGTKITSDKDVALYAGHNCAFVPYEKWACDHLEEQIYPLKSWGKHYLGTHTDSSGQDPNLYRVISAEKGNKITFTPAVQQPVTLDEGKYLEFTTKDDFDVSGTGRFLLVQFIVGQNYSNLNPGAGAPGDPSMSLGVPVEQYRTSYRFLAPETYEQNYVNVMAPTSANDLKLDEQFVDASKFATIGSTGFKVAKLKIPGGPHRLTSSSAFGIAVYGVGSYTSYMYPGGLDLKLLIY